MARSRSTYRHARREAARVYYRAAPRFERTTIGAYTVAAPAGFRGEKRKPRSTGAAAVVPPASLADPADELSLLVAKRNRMPWGTPGRRELTFRIRQLAGQIEWSDQWASGYDDLTPLASAG